MIWGTRVSLVAGIVSVALAALGAGSVLGVLAGYAGGRVDGLVMRLMDAVLSFPPLVLALALGAVLGAGLTGVLIALGVVYTPTFARLMRGQVLAIKARDYVDAARALGRAGLAHRLPSRACPTPPRRSWCRPRSAWRSRSWPRPRCRFSGSASSRPRRRGAA